MEISNINEAPIPKLGFARVAGLDLSSAVKRLSVGLEDLIRDGNFLKNKKLNPADISKRLLTDARMQEHFFNIADKIAMDKYGKSFKELEKLSKNGRVQRYVDMIDDSYKETSKVWHEELNKQLKSMGSKTQKALNNKRVNGTGKEVRGLTNDLKNTDKIKNLLTDKKLGKNILTYDDLKKHLSTGSKTKTFNGKTLLERLKLSNIWSNGRRVRTTNNPSFLRRTVRVIMVNASVKGTIIALVKFGVLPGLILYQFFGVGKNEDAVIVDENGKDIFETKTDDKTEMGSVLNQFIKAGGTKTKDSGVNVITPEFPKGLTYYSNGRVRNNETGEMGSWMLNEGLSLLDLLNEQETPIDTKLNNDVEKVIDYLDFPVSKDDLKNTYLTLKPYVSNGKGREFLDLYKRSGWGGGSLDKSLRYVFTTSTDAASYKKNIFSLISQMESGKGVSANQTSNGAPKVSTNFPKTMITWDNGTMATTGGTTHSTSTVNGSTNPSSVGHTQTKKPSMKFHDCTGKDFPLEFGCVNNRIKDLQSCLGLTADGKFGPRTLKMLKDYANDLPNNMLTYDIWNNITSSCQDSNNGGLHNIDSDNTQGVDLNNNKGDMNVDVNESPNKFYKSLMRNGNIDTVFAPNGRDTLVRYRGPELAEDDLNKLDTALNGMNFIRTTEPSISGTYLYKRK